MAAGRSKHCFLLRLAPTPVRDGLGLLGIVARAAWVLTPRGHKGTRGFYPIVALQELLPSVAMARDGRMRVRFGGSFGFVAGT